MIDIIYSILGALLLAHMIVAATATVVVLRDGNSDRFQVISKILVSWIVIYAGPLFILYVMNEHSSEVVPEFAKSGFLHYLLFAPIKPSHRDNLLANEDGSYPNSDASDLGIGGEGTCGAGGD